ncbi:MAG TPA: peroxidase family protein, partial [Pyrinomonadaceae bacterium]|nr:peroxidase family protein [Pyrinomonadaceae bacterium]
MRTHEARASYFVDEKIVREPDYLAGGNGCPMAASQPAQPAGCPAFKFGFMFDKPRQVRGAVPPPIDALVDLGNLMNHDSRHHRKTDSFIPSGYTYLGQFIAHEITFDNSEVLPDDEPDPQLARSPSIDLDSLYGANRKEVQTQRQYNGPLLRVGTTDPTISSNPDTKLKTFENDLPRDETGQALIGDKRNDENLAVAQVNVALIKFHNKVVESIKTAGEDEDSLFERAREQVVKHFQWVVLRDYLPKVVDNKILDEVENDVRNNGVAWLKDRAGAEKNLFMPLEFSAAAFRLGHSMVREKYQWNVYHSTELGGAASGASLSQLFDQTNFSGGIGPSPNSPQLRSEWVIDWRRFFRFPAKLGYETPPTDAPGTYDGANVAKKIDTNFDFHLNKIAGFDHANLPPSKRSITVRNLLRGHALGLPSGEEVADAMGIERLDQATIAGGRYQAIINKHFQGQTPLWFYILKEAEVTDHDHLGPLGSRIVASVLLGIIKKSKYSILNDRNWYPEYTERGEPKTESAE